MHLNVFIVICFSGFIIVELGEPPTIIEHPLDAIVSKGRPATLNCAAKGENVQITWYKDGEPVTTNKDQMNSHRILLDTGALFLLKVNSGRSGKDGDAGSYHCVARNQWGNATSREGILKIAMLRDDFRISPRTVQEVSGNKAILECSPPRGFPEPVVSWRKDDKDLRVQEEPHMTLHPDGNLIIDPVKHSDSGTYQCVATNMVGDRVSNPARLSVYEKPTFIQTPKDVVADVGSSVLFDCRVSGEPQPQISWRKKDAQMPVARAYIAKDNRGLRLDRVELSDEGEYQCYAKNPAGTIEASARLRVQALPSFMTEPTDQTVALGESASFDCVPTGQPVPAMFWNKEGQQNLLFPGHVSADQRMRVSSKGTLTISGVRYDDVGAYVCAAMNPVGSSLTKAKLIVSGSGQPINPPPVIEFGHHNQTLPVSASAILPCQARGRTPPLISWLFNGKVLDPVSHVRFSQHSSGSLHIVDLRKSDSGLYTCKAKNDDGESDWTASLVVEGHNSNVVFSRMPDSSAFPSAPSQPKIKAVGETDVTLEWKAPEMYGTAPVTDYIIQYFSPSAGATWLNVPDHVEKTTYQVKDLTPGQAYVFIIRAENEKGIGPPSALSAVAKTVSKNPDDPNSAQRLMGQQLIKLEEIKSINSTAVRLFWKRKKAEVTIDGYYVKWRAPPKSNIDQWVNVSGGHVESFVVSGLLPFTNYEFFVIPYRGKIQGAPSNSMDVITDEAPPSLPPVDVKLRMLNITTLRVSWKPPATEGINGVLRGYQIIVNGSKSSKWNRNITTHERAGSVTIFHLQPGMTYRIRVSARTSAGVGVSHGTDVIVMNEETLLKHTQNNDGESFLSQLFMRRAWIFVLTVLGWIAAVLVAIFIYFKCRNGDSNGKDRTFIKINEGSVQMGGQNGMWDTGTYNSGLYNRGLRTFNGPVNQNEMHYAPEYMATSHRPASEQHYHYAQLASGPDNAMTTFYGNQFQDDPSPYATTTLIMSAKQPSWMSDTLMRGPVLPSNPIPNGPPARYMDTEHRLRTSRVSEQPPGSHKSDSPPHTDVSYVQFNPSDGTGGSSTGRSKTGTLGGKRSPPKQTLMDFIPPPPINPPPRESRSYSRTQEDPYDCVSTECGRGDDTSASKRPTSRNRSAGVRAAKNNPDEDSQRSSLMLDESGSSEADGEISDLDQPRRTMPRMGVSVSQIHQNSHDVCRTGARLKSLHNKQEHL